MMRLRNTGKNWGDLIDDVNRELRKWSAVNASKTTPGGDI
jgi:hypothetical protein